MIHFTCTGRLHIVSHNFNHLNDVPQGLRRQVQGRHFKGSMAWQLVELLTFAAKVIHMAMEQD